MRFSMLLAYRRPSHREYILSAMIPSSRPATESVPPAARLSPLPALQRRNCGGCEPAILKKYG
jgi:hypothetical protein